MNFPFICALDNCNHEIDRYGRFEFLLGVSSKKTALFKNWNEIQEYKGSWLMGLLPYELKDQFEKQIFTSKEASITFPLIPLFEPEFVVGIKRGSQDAEILKGNPTGLLESSPLQKPPKQAWKFQPNFTKEGYLKTIKKLQQHIVDGDIYEVNLAQAFTAKGKLQEPDFWFRQLTKVSPVPFAAFIRWEDQYLLCASPERFLQHKDGILRTQPIKGTAPRSANPTKDKAHFDYLYGSEKEKAENVMIVDLSRNDLYRSSIPHSVHVPHLFEIQAFPQVYQMVSTIEGQKDPALPWHEVISRCFPPGSMTGAPKVKSMELIDRYEPFSRGIYAGSAGYVMPNGEFDWNVIIRSLVYDDARELLSYHVGGAITYDSDPMMEYEETLLKASALRRIFG
ncbi:MAG: anthranilate synthase component I family protein [Bacteroidia bacterium]|nr:anthranilate synthase component I family protein [Bacteroidia bacterium]